MTEIDLKSQYRHRLEELEPQRAAAFTPLFWDGSCNKPIDKHYKISICTTCMNRLSDLSQTLPENIANNQDYPHIEFVVLDYNTTKDDLPGWIKANMMPHIESGKLIYCRTEDPQFYSMTHSRNLAFKMASGDIVNNVDADNYTALGFAAHLNKLANQIAHKAFFAKGRRMLRGRLGFYRDEFIDVLGGYEESIEDYGHDDHDLMERAWALGFSMLWFGGDYFAKTESKKHQTQNMKNTSWKETELRNKVMSWENIVAGKWKANEGREWGKAKIIKNFTKEIDL